MACATFLVKQLGRQAEAALLAASSTKVAQSHRIHDLQSKHGMGQYAGSFPSSWTVDPAQKALQPNSSVSRPVAATVSAPRVACLASTKQPSTNLCASTPKPAKLREDCGNADVTFSAEQAKGSRRPYASRFPPSWIIHGQTRVTRSVARLNFLPATSSRYNTKQLCLQCTVTHPDDLVYLLDVFNEDILQHPVHNAQCGGRAVVAEFECAVLEFPMCRRWWHVSTS